MAIIYKYSCSSLFIIFTANPKQDKITCKLLPSQITVDRPNLITRVFCIKVTYLLYDLKRKQIFSQYCGCIQTIKYQKQGLPYIYLLLFLYLYNRDRLLDLAVINYFISIKLLQLEDNPISCLTKIIKSIIVYSLCGSQNLQAPYIVIPELGLPPTYSKRYPKPFNPATIIYKDSYPKYYYCNDLQLQSIHLLRGAIFKIDNR